MSELQIQAVGQVEIDCPVCSVKFRAKAPHQRFCGTPCRIENFRRERPTYQRDYSRAHPGRRAPSVVRANITPVEHCKILAHDAVRSATKRGLLVRQPCEVCGDTKAEAHHCDYSKPLDVMWLCRLHHKKWHGKHVALLPESLQEMKKVKK